MPVKASSIEREVKRLKATTSDWLLNRDDYVRQALEERQETIMAGSSSIGDGMPRASGNGDPTGQKGSRMADKLATVQAWVELIAEVEQGLPDRMLVFLLLRREYRNNNGRIGWTASVQWKYAEQAAKRCGTKPEDEWVENRHTFKDWWNNIVTMTTILAAKRGLL